MARHTHETPASIIAGRCGTSSLEIDEVYERFRALTAESATA